MRFERDTIFTHLAQAGQAHHLKPATVGEDWTLPIHKFMQPTEAINALRCRAQHQMIGVAQKNISTSFTYGARQHGLNRGRCTHGHEGWRANISARDADCATSGLAGSGVQLE